MNSKALAPMTLPFILIALGLGTANAQTVFDADRIERHAPEAELNAHEDSRPRDSTNFRNGGARFEHGDNADAAILNVIEKFYDHDEIIHRRSLTDRGRTKRDVDRVLDLAYPKPGEVLRSRRCRASTRTRSPSRCRPPRY